MLTKQYYIKPELLPLAVENVNKLHTWINDNANDILAIIKDASIKKDGGLYKKDQEKIDLILSTQPFHSWLHFSYMSVYLEAEITTPTKIDIENNYQTVKYIKRSIYFGQWQKREWMETIQPLPIFELSDIQGLIQQASELYTIAENAVSRLNAVQCQLAYFTEQ